MTRLLAALAMAAIMTGGCGLVPFLTDGPTVCQQVYSPDQCLAMADVAAAEIGKTRGDVVSIEIVPHPPPEGASLGGAWPVRVRIHMADGSAHQADMCGGLPFGAACSDEPQLMPVSIMGGYRDVPCAGEPPDGCATPHPTLEPAAIDQAEPLIIDARAIPIDHNGRYAVELGEGSLPNGILTQASFEFDEAWPKDVALRDGRATLEIRSLEPDGKPFENYYLHGWRPGVERVEARLLFDVLWFEPGADLGIRNIFVR